MEMDKIVELLKQYDAEVYEFNSDAVLTRAALLDAIRKVCEERDNLLNINRNLVESGHWPERPVFDDLIRQRDELKVKLEQAQSDISVLRKVVEERDEGERKLDRMGDFLEHVSIWLYKQQGNPLPIWADEFTSVCQMMEPTRKEDKMNEDVLKIINKDGTITEVENPFGAMQDVIMARTARYATVKSLLDLEILSPEQANEILSGPLTPGDKSTIYDDSKLLDLETAEEVKNMICKGEK